MKVLFLSEWYPHRYDAMAGLFVRKHAVAVARQGVDVCVLYLHHDDTLTHREIIEQHTESVREIYVYYPSRYLSALKAGWQYTRSQWGMPDICQLNVISKNAILPLWLRLRFHIPYIIVEHWTGYLRQNGAYLTGSKAHRLIAQTAVHHAAAIATVSDKLAEAMQDCGLLHPRYERVDNVVDDFFFKRAIRSPHKPLNLLHISCFNERAKNVKGLLRAVRNVCKQRTDFTLTIVGNGIDYTAVRSYANLLRFPDGILRWTDELPPEQVAEQFDFADAFLLFSHYETCGVVLLESLATGTPIISTPVGIAPEIITPDNGILIAEGNEASLTQAINRLLDHPDSYNRQTIRAAAAPFSEEAVGKKLLTIYNTYARL